MKIVNEIYHFHGLQKISVPRKTVLSPQEFERKSKLRRGGQPPVLLQRRRAATGPADSEDVVGKFLDGLESVDFDSRIEFGRNGAGADDMQHIEFQIVERHAH